MTTLLALLAALAASPCRANVLLSLDPASLPEGRLSEDSMHRACNAPWADGLKEGRGRIVSLRAETGAAPERALRVRYLAEKIGPEASVQFWCPLPPSENAYLEYWVKLGDETGFDFMRGGKLPGLCGGKCNSGGKKPTGDGWSSRFMWRANGKIILYLYHLGQAGKYGDVLELGEFFGPNEWHRLGQRVTLNSPDKADGSVEVWIDGKPALKREGLRLRDRGSVKIDRFYFSTFYGGDDATWAPPREETADFKGFRVLEGAEGPSGP